MSRFLKGLKAGLGYFIVGILMIVGGIILLFVVDKDHQNLGMTIGGGALLLFGGVFAFITPVFVARDKMRSICESCQKSMTKAGAEYTYEGSQLNERYSTQQNGAQKFVGFEAIYTCTIKCPHCGNVNMFTKTISAKNTAKCNKGIDDYMKSLLKIK